MNSVTMYIGIGMSLLIAMLTLAVKLQRDSINELKTEKVRLEFEILGYKNELDVIIKDKGLRKDIDDRVNTGISQLQTGFSLINSSLYDIYFESLKGSCETIVVSKDCNCSNKPSSTSSSTGSSQRVEKVTNLIEDAWCLIDKQMEHCVK